MICFIGTSFAPTHFKGAALKRGFTLTEYPEKADLVFVSEDTPTKEGKRDLICIKLLIEYASDHVKKGVSFVLTSQVPPGFTRSLGLNIYHLAETLRVTRDSEDRALNPEQFIVGCEDPTKQLPDAFMKYLLAFECPIHKVSWEEAEFSKIAINMTLASQVDNANRLSAAAVKVGARWDVIKTILQHDKRIGPHSYLTPGRWQDSQHLLRDFVTLEQIENDWNIE